MSAEALFLTFAGSINAVADGLYILLLAAGAHRVTSDRTRRQMPVARSVARTMAPPTTQIGTPTLSGVAPFSRSPARPS
jgi:hypothetical protein